MSQAQSRDSWMHRYEDPRRDENMCVVGPCGQRLTIAGVGLRGVQQLRWCVIPARSEVAGSYQRACMEQGRRAGFGQPGSGCGVRGRGFGDWGISSHKVGQKHGTQAGC